MLSRIDGRIRTRALVIVSLLLLFILAGFNQLSAREIFDSSGVADADFVKKYVINELINIKFPDIDVSDYRINDIKIINNILNVPQVYVFIFEKINSIENNPEIKVKEAFNKYKFNYDKKSDITFDYDGLLRESRQGDKYFFVIAGATKDRFPIIEVGTGLPTYRYFSQICQAIAKDKFKDDEINFDGKVIFSGHRDFWLHFFIKESGIKAQKSFYIHATMHKIINEEDLRMIELSYEAPPLLLEIEGRKTKAWKREISQVNIQAISRGYISGVPNWAQRSDDCTPNAATNLIGYYDSHPYSNRYYGKLIDNPGKIYFDLTLQLREAMEWVKGKGVHFDEVAPGIKKVCNSPSFGNSYKFSAIPGIVWFSDLKREIDSGRPVIYNVKGHYYYKTHSMVAVGYLDGTGTDYVQVHNSWGSETWIEFWDALYDMVTVCPGGGTTSCPAYNENFDDGIAQGWNEKNLAYWKVADKTYRAFKSTVTAELSMVSTYNSGIYNDFVYRVKLRKEGAYATYIIFRATGDFKSVPYSRGSGYAFGIDQHEYYGKEFYVYKVNNGTFTTIKSWTESDYINPTTQWNTLKVVAKGYLFKLYINGNFVYEFTDNTITSGRVGLLGYTGTEAEGGENFNTRHFFDNVYVSINVNEINNYGAQESISPKQQWLNDQSIGGSPEKFRLKN